MTLEDFLLARFAEDEALWRLAAEGQLEMQVTASRESVSSVPTRGFADRMLAECDAKRRLVDWAAPYSGDIQRVPTDRPGVYDAKALRYITDDGEDVLRLLALPYIDHEDYREEWRP